MAAAAAADTSWKKGDLWLLATVDALVFVVHVLASLALVLDFPERLLSPDWSQVADKCLVRFVPPNNFHKQSFFITTCFFYTFIFWSASVACFLRSPRSSFSALCWPVLHEETDPSSWPWYYVFYKYNTDLLGSLSMTYFV
jgi:hypothetical protein